MVFTLDSLNKDVPFMMNLLFKLSWFTNYTVLVALVVAMVVPFFWDQVAALFAHDVTLSLANKLKNRALRLSAHVPGLRRVFQAFAQERFTRALSLQLEAGRPLVPSLRSSFRATANPVFMDCEEEVIQGIMNGEPLEELLRSTGLFDEISFLSFFKVSEESGLTADVLKKSADLQAESIDASLASGMAALEPILLLAVGVFIGAIIISFFMPLMDLMQTF
jgi:type II secretory pathway component PulF